MGHYLLDTQYIYIYRERDIIKFCVSGRSHNTTSPLLLAASKVIRLKASDLQYVNKSCRKVSYQNTVIFIMIFFSLFDENSKVRVLGAKKPSLFFTRKIVVIQCRICTKLTPNQNIIHIIIYMNIQNKGLDNDIYYSVLESAFKTYWSDLITGG